MRILSQNFCLGLINKVDLARKWTMHLTPDILIIQEAELTEKTDFDILQIPNYELFHTQMHPKSRLAVYINKNLKCRVTQCSEAEIIAVESGRETIFCCYRPFKIDVKPKTYIQKMVDFVRQNVKHNSKIYIIRSIKTHRQLEPVE